MRAYESVRYENIAAGTKEFDLSGGLYQWNAMASWGGGNAVLAQQAADNVTYLTVTDPVTANGGFTLYLPPGHFKLTITTATGVYFQLTRIPSE